MTSLNNISLMLAPPFFSGGEGDEGKDGPEPSLQFTANPPVDAGRRLNALA